MPAGKRAILFLASWYPVDQNPFHGIFIRNHALALSRFEPVVTVYAYSSYEGPFFKVEKTSVNEHFTEYRVKYPKPSLVIPGLKAVEQFRKLKKAYRLLLEALINDKAEIKAIQVNVVFPVAIVLDLFKTHYNVKHTIAENWSGYLESDGNYKGAVMKYYTERCFKEASKIWHVSEPMKQAMLKHGLGGNFELLYNTVNTDVFKPAETATRETIRFLHVSSLVEREKNVLGTLRVFKKLEENYKVELIVVGGTGEELEEAKQYASDLEIKNISFLGTMPPEKISAQMQLSSALVLFSNYEGMPVVALEALSCALPVLATRVGALPYLISEKFGSLAEPANEREMLETLEKFVNGNYNFDPQAMRDFIMRHASYEAVGRQLADGYKD